MASLTQPPSPMGGLCGESLAPLTTTGGYGGALLFGREGLNPVSRVGALFRIDATSYGLDRLDPGTPVDTAIVPTPVDLFLAGGFVVSVGGGLLNGPVILQEPSGTGIILWSLDPDAMPLTFTPLTPGLELGPAVIDTQR